MKTLHDLEVLVPLFAGGEKYAKRMQAFKSHGLLNMSDHQVHIKALIGTDKPENYYLDWGSMGCSIVSLIDSEYDHVAQKIYQYYIERSDENLLSRWYIRVDDDSSTNVGPLIDWLDRNFDYNEPHYFTTKQCWDITKIYKNAFEKEGWGHLAPQNNKGKGGDLPDNFIPHEWECCITSQGMMKRIAHHEGAMKFLRRLSYLPLGFGDMGLALAARITKFAVAEVEVLSARPDIRNYSAFGGDIHHIHFIAPDLPYYGHFTRELMNHGYRHQNPV